MNVIIDEHRTDRAIDRRTAPLIGLAGAGAAVSLTLGVYGRVHTPTGQGIVTFGFPAVLPMKAWFTTAAMVLVVVQVVTALRMWNRLAWLRTAPAWLPSVWLPTHWLPSLHRWSGTIAFVLTLPVAYHCLWALGFQDTSPRRLVHSVLGCAFYGAFTTKMLALRNRHLPRWSLPVLGGALAALLTGLWLTSSLWFFTNVGFPGV
jgi:hypothetical protein